MALLSIGGIPISNTVYAVSAIILLPINSSINPIVYSSAINRIFQKFKKSKAVNKFNSNRMWPSKMWSTRMWSFRQSSRYNTENSKFSNQTVTVF